MIDFQSVGETVVLTLIGALLFARLIVWVQARRAHLTVSKYLDEVRRRNFVRRDLPKIWRKNGFCDSVWALEYRCPREGSMLYSLKGFLFCPVCSYSPGYDGRYARRGLNTGQAPTSGDR